MFLDKTINPSYHIRKLYDNIEKQNIDMPLYENILELKQNEDKEPIQNTTKTRKQHYAQMGGQYSLSPSQRESLNHYNNIEEGEVLAIQGPPGTGKTTLLQSVVANEYVSYAIKKELPPLIVAASTNNQAVTNIIESFGKIVPKFKNNLEMRWIEKVNSFAMYFPSKQKAKIAKQKGFQYTNNKGENSLLEIDNNENIEESKKKFFEEAQKLFPNLNGRKNLDLYKEKIHSKLIEINNAQNNLIEIVEKLEQILSNEKQENIITKTDEQDLWLDVNTRYVSFWLAVHYYEARWLQNECALTEKQKGTTYANVLINFYRRLSMITPCLVMTFYMLPKQFAIYNEDDNRQFLYNMIDTLIVDEAGQVSTEIGTCSFALAKKAIVVGDDKQIPPVWV